MRTLQNLGLIAWAMSGLPITCLAFAARWATSAWIIGWNIADDLEDCLYPDHDRDRVLLRRSSGGPG